MYVNSATHETSSLSKCESSQCLSPLFVFYFWSNCDGDEVEKSRWDIFLLSFFFLSNKIRSFDLFRSLASISIILITRFARKLPGCMHQFCIPRGVRTMPRRLQQPEDDPGGHNCNLNCNRVTANRCPGARFPKIPVFFRARNQIFKSTYKNKGADPAYQTTPFCFISW